MLNQPPGRRTPAWSLQTLQELQASGRQLAQAVSAAQAAAAAERQRAAGLRKELAAERAAKSAATTSARCHSQCSRFPGCALLRLGHVGLARKIPRVSSRPTNICLVLYRAIEVASRWGCTSQQRSKASIRNCLVCNSRHDPPSKYARQSVQAAAGGCRGGVRDGA